MNKKKLFFISPLFVTVALLITIGQKQKNNSKPIQKNQVIKFSNTNKNIEEKELTSYFWPILISYIINCSILFYLNLNNILPFLKLKPYKININENLEAYNYLVFIKSALGIFSLENCHFAVNNSYQKKITISLTDFLNKFLINKQNNKVRQKARQILFCYRQNWSLIAFLTYLFLLFFNIFISFIINLIFNFFFHGKKTWKKIKVNSIWKIITNMKYKTEKIISYLCIFLSLIFCVLECLFHLSCKNKQTCMFFQRNNNLGYYYLIRHFFHFYTFNSFKYKNNNSFHKQLDLTKNGKEIYHRNLDPNLHPLEKDFDNCQHYLIQWDNSFKTNEFQIFLDEMHQYFSCDEENIFKQFTNFASSLES